jgi:hypothetical protein
VNTRLVLYRVDESCAPTTIVDDYGSTCSGGGSAALVSKTLDDGVLYHVLVHGYTTTFWGFQSAIAGSYRLRMSPSEARAGADDREPVLA